MMSEADVRRAAIGWRAAHEAMVTMNDKDGALLADGYARALEMVLRVDSESTDSGSES